MKPSDLFFTPKDVWLTIKGLRWRHALGLLAAVLAGLGATKVAGQEAGVFAGLLVFLIIARAAPAIPFTLAVITFVMIIIATPLQGPVDPGDTSITEKFAVWAFYLLVIGVILLIIDSIWPVDEPQPATGKRFVHPIFGQQATPGAQEGVELQDTMQKKKRLVLFHWRHKESNAKYVNSMHEEHLKEAKLQAAREANEAKATSLLQNMKRPLGPNSKLNQDIRPAPAAPRPAAQPFRKAPRGLGMEITPQPKAPKAKKPAAPKNLIRW